MSSPEESSSDEEDNTVYGKAKRQRRNAPAWKKQLTKELLKPKLKRFPRRKVFSPSVDAIWAGDLLDIHQYARVNKNYTFILVLIDVFSKYAWARPQTKKVSALQECLYLIAAIDVQESYGRIVEVSFIIKVSRIH